MRKFEYKAVPAPNTGTKAKGVKTTEDRFALSLTETLNEMAEARGQTLAQMALAWVLRGGRVTTALIGASKPSQIVDCAGVVENMEFTDAELAKIDEISSEEAINLWARSSEME